MLNLEMMVLTLEDQLGREFLCPLLSCSGIAGFGWLVPKKFLWPLQRSFFNYSHRQAPWGILDGFPWESFRLPQIQRGWKLLLTNPLQIWGGKKRKRKKILHLDATSKNKETEFHAFCLESRATAMSQLHKHCYRLVRSAAAEHYNIDLKRPVPVVSLWGLLHSGDLGWLQKVSEE